MDCIGQEREKQVLLSNRIYKQFDRSFKIMHRFFFAMNSKYVN